jgi:hypothetical protein
MSAPTRKPSNPAVFLRYFKGEANEQGECLSFCLWETREQAIEAAGAAAHQSAAEISVRMYESYMLDRYSPPGRR